MDERIPPNLPKKERAIPPQPERRGAFWRGFGVRFGAMTLDVFLLILRLLGIVLLYLFLMQVIISITRDLRKTADVNLDVGELIVVDSGPSQIAPGTRFKLEPQTTIGRGPTNTIQINETFVSAEHTRMWVRKGVWYVQDAGSTNGTYLNNQPARSALQARSGDIIQVGFLRFKLSNPLDERRK